MVKQKTGRNEEKMNLLSYTESKGEKLGGREK